jgi:hypothetical protein
MSTLTISAPIAAPRRPRTRPMAAQLPRVRGTRPVTWLVGPVRARSVATARPVAARGALRLTRRGRLVILAMLLVVGAVVSLAITSSGAASSTAQAIPVQYVTVAPGDTLWSIAGEVAPDADRRDTVAQIIERNALPGSSVEAGQRLAIPVAR